MSAPAKRLVAIAWQPVELSMAKVLLQVRGFHVDTFQSPEVAIAEMPAHVDAILIWSHDAELVKQLRVASPGSRIVVCGGRAEQAWLAGGDRVVAHGAEFHRRLVDVCIVAVTPKRSLHIFTQGEAARGVATA